MYISELNIFGFKSFAKKTSIVFHDGMTAIVGPNGCGKSNVVDAIRWVLGEQKTGVLRSDRMENVIFNGSRSAKPLGMSEVSLKIQNTKNLLPVEYSEVVVTRRLFRSGESQYLINGKTCRLKDILDLFMDTGIGPHAYSVIELSMVESILNGKPEERRKIFEEAAGITKYKMRRKATFRRLEATEKDLIRIDDIMAEVEKSVRSLRRQVRKAQNFQKISNRLRELEIKIANHEYAILINELEPLLTKIEILQDEREEKTAALSTLEADSESVRARLIQIEQKLTSTQKALNELNERISESEDKVLINRERIKALEDAGVRYSDDQEQAKEKMGRLNKLLAQGSNRRAELEQKLAAQEKLFQEQSEQYQTEQTKLNALRSQMVEAEQKLFDITEDLNKKRNEVERLGAVKEGLDQRLQQFDSEDIQANTQREHLQLQIGKLQKKHNQVESEITRIQQLHAEKIEAYDSLLTSIDVLRKTDMVAGNRIQKLSDQAEMAKRLLETLGDYPEGVRFLSQTEDAEFSSAGPLATLIQVQAAHRQAIATALGEAINYLVVENHSSALRGIQLLKQDERGSVSFLPAELVKARSLQMPQIDDADFIGWAHQLVRCQEAFRSLVETVLPRVAVVRSLEAARRLAPSLHPQEISIVTLDGELLSYWGLIRGGSKSPDQSQVVGRREHLIELRKKIDKLRSESDKRQQEISDSENTLQEMAEAQESLANELQARRDDLSKLQMESAQLKFQEESIRRESEKRKEQRKQLREDISLQEKILTQAHQEILEMEQTKKSLRQKLDSTRDRFEEQEQSLSAQSSKVHEFNLGIVQIQGMLQSLDQQNENLAQQIHEAEQLIETREQEKQQSLEEIAALKQNIVAQRKAVADGVVKKDEYQKQVEGLQDEQYEINARLGQVDLTVREQRSQVDKVKEELHQHEMRASELKIRAENSRSRMREEYEYEIQAEQLDSSIDVDELRRDVEDLRYKLKAIGPVNLLALKEYEQEKERLDFLKTQRDDLFRAKQNLTETIEMINTTARQKFLETFEHVQNNFSEVFKRFFEGGQASLILRSGGDPLEEGIDIMATPGGKRVQALSLMSGGEKALTAISLLLAIYLVKPSPFCIFDEVDAPLDDQNIRRFTNALAEFSKNTQFITVTHNKLTMRAADQMYGVTMEQDGVSKVVSVKFDRMQEKTPVPIAQG